MNVQLLDEAKQDLIEGFRFYEGRQAGLGDYFLDSLFSDIESLQLYAGIHSVHVGFHRLLSQRFPFAIFYDMVDDGARVWAVLDCRKIQRESRPGSRRPNRGHRWAETDPGPTRTDKPRRVTACRCPCGAEWAIAGAMPARTAPARTNL